MNIKMNETLKIYNYEHELFDTGLPLSEIKELTVHVISGDEIVDVTKVDGTTDTFDAADLAGDPRCMFFYDGNYDITKEQLSEWIKRTDSYDWDDLNNI